jgi:predicted nucleic acid-binding protein
MKPVLHDAVSLRHFAIIKRLELLQAAHENCDPPRWTEVVHGEIERSVRHQASCADILQMSWLGEPVEPAIEDLAAVFELQVALNEGRRPPAGDRGEAESIFFAEKLGGTFLTDDNGAFDFAMRRPTLGPGRVRDSVDVLRVLVADGTITTKEAAEAANDIGSAGRSFRRCHPDIFAARDFD